MSDLIDRKQAIDAVSEWLWNVLRIKESDGQPSVFKSLRSLPSAQPERMRARWEDAHRSKWDGTFYWFIKCNNCGYERKDDDHDLDAEYKFCPNCGYDMR